MKVRRGKGGNPAEVPADTSRVADIGFGDGRRLRGMEQKEGRVIEGIESPTAHRIKLPGKLLRYIGFDEWLKIAKNNAYETIYADLFFHHYFHEKIFGRLSVQGEVGAYSKIEMKVMSLVFGKTMKKLVPGGTLEFSLTVSKSIKQNGVPEKEQSIRLMKSILKEAGFVNVNAREMGKSEAMSSHSAYVLGYPDAVLLVFTANKPSPKKKTIRLGASQKIFVVHKNGQAEERLM